MLNHNKYCFIPRTNRRIRPFPTFNIWKVIIGICFRMVVSHRLRCMQFIINVVMFVLFMIVEKIDRQNKFVAYNVSSFVINFC